MFSSVLEGDSWWDLGQELSASFPKEYLEQYRVSKSDVLFFSVFPVPFSTELLGTRWGDKTSVSATLAFLSLSLTGAATPSSVRRTVKPSGRSCHH